MLPAKQAALSLVYKSLKKKIEQLYTKKNKTTCLQN